METRGQAMGELSTIFTLILGDTGLPEQRWAGEFKLTPHSSHPDLCCYSIFVSLFFLTVSAGTQTGEFASWSWMGQVRNVNVQ